METPQGLPPKGALKGTRTSTKHLSVTTEPTDQGGHQQQEAQQLQGRRLRCTRCSTRLDKKHHLKHWHCINGYVVNDIKLFLLDV